MKATVLALLTSIVGAGILSNSKLKTKRPTNGSDFEEKLRKGNQLLNNERNANDTMRLLRQLHNMKDEIKRKLTLSSQQKADLLEMTKNYVKVDKDRIQSKGGRIEEINRISEVDVALFQGDMILTRKQAEEIINGVKENKSKRPKRQAFRDKDYPKYLWSSGVNYDFWNSSDSAKRVFKKATMVWSWSTCINFRETKAAADKIVVVEGVGCWSHIGRIGRDQVLSLGRGCDTVGTAVHEIGHALGLYHTHSRHDRDNFITLNSQKIQPGWESQYVKETEQTNYNYNLTYDYGSVMHYGATSVSIDGQPFMIPHDWKFLQTIGSHFLSFYDILMINLHYKCNEKCAQKSSAKCQNGGFPHPRDCSQCICPSGYGGKLCNERPLGCGRTLEATYSYQTLNDTVGRQFYDPYGDNDEFFMCHYWIEAPAGSTIEVTIVNYTEGLAVDGCIFAGVEIKTLADKRHTGYRFCSPRYAGTTLISAYNIVPIITYSRIYETSTILRYRIASSGPATNERKSRSTHRPNPLCMDGAMCSKFSEQDFCESDEYNDDFKRVTCPKLCRIC